MWMKRNQEQWSDLSYKRKLFFCQHCREVVKEDSDVNGFVILETESLFLMTSLCSLRDKNIYRITEVTHQKLIKGPLYGPWESWGNCLSYSGCNLVNVSMNDCVTLFNVILCRYQAEHHSMHPILLR